MRANDHFFFFTLTFLLSIIPTCITPPYAILSNHLSPPLPQSTDASAGERTKFKALVRYYVEGKQNALGKPNEPLADEKVASLAKILEVSASNKSATHPTRPDKRFPNQNQVNSCW